MFLVNKHLQSKAMAPRLLLLDWLLRRAVGKTLQTLNMS